jgi:hypothetical protein
MMKKEKGDDGWDGTDGRRKEMGDGEGRLKKRRRSSGRFRRKGKELRMADWGEEKRERCGRRGEMTTRVSGLV